MAAIGVGVLSDYALRFPGWLRAGVFVLASATAIGIAVRLLAPIVRFRPRSSDLALAIGRHAGDAADDWERAGALVELAEREATRATAAGSGGLLVAAQRRASASLPAELGFAGGSGRARGSVGSFAGVARAAAVLGLALATAALGVAWKTDLAIVGLKRVLTPWESVAWPRRTTLADATGVVAQPTNTAMLLRADVLDTVAAPGRTRIVATYRVLIDGRQVDRPGQIVLSLQPARAPGVGDEAASSAGRPEPRETYAQVIDPAAWTGFLARASSEAGAPPAAIEYWFDAVDHRVGPVRVPLVEPPMVRRVVATIDAPEYARPWLGSSVPGASELASGVIEASDAWQARLGRALVGSEVEVVLQFAQAVERVETLPAIGAGALTAGLERGVLEIDRSGTRAVVRGVVVSDVVLRLRPIDRFGLAAVRDTIVEIAAHVDQPPTASVIRPAEDEWVLASSTVEATGEGRDDVGVGSVGLRWQRAEAVRSSRGAPPEPTGEPTTFAQIQGGNADVPRVDAPLALATTGAVPGDEVWLTAVASDGFRASAADGTQRVHDPAVSPVRRLRVLTEEQFVERVWVELGMVREAVRALDAQQAEAMERAGEGSNEQDAREQAGIAAQIQAQRGAMDRVRQRMARQGLERDDLERVMDESASGLDEAAQAAQRAEEAVAGERAEQARDEQQRVRDELERVMRALDRGEDAFLARRGVQSLLDQQRALAEQSRQAMEATAGRDAESLTRQEQRTLDELAQRQEQLSQRAEEALDELARQREELATKDPVSAEALARAERTGREQGLAQQASEAAEQIERNQGQRASSSQQAASETLEQMLEQIDRAERERDRVLERLFEDLAEQIAGLIAEQERQIQSLEAAAGAGEAIDVLSGGMIELHRRLLPVIEQASGGLPEARSVVDALESASQAMLRAIDRLGVSASGAARQAEGESLAALRTALEESQRLGEAAEEREQRRLRELLEREHRELLALQQGVRDDSGGLAGRELQRKDRVLARRIGVRQAEVAQRIREMPARIEGAAEAGALRIAHARIEALADRSSGRLEQGRVDGALLADQDSAIRLLQRIIDTLAGGDRDQDQQEFAQGGGQQGSGQQGNQGPGPLIADLEQLQLLRELQIDLYEQTRAAGDAAGEEGGAEATMQDLVQLQEALAAEVQALIEAISQQPVGGGGGGGG